MFSTRNFSEKSTRIDKIIIDTILILALGEKRTE